MITMSNGKVNITVKGTLTLDAANVLIGRRKVRPVGGDI